MNIALLLSGLLGVASAAGHSWLSERYVLRPLLAESDSRVLASPAMRRLMRAVWHLPSASWALTGVLTYGFVHHGMVNDLTASQSAPPVWFVVYGALVYGLPAAANAWALRKVHPGNVLLSLAAALLIVGSV